MGKFIPVNEPLLDGNEKKYLAECIDTGWISSEGPFVKRFEEEFAAKVGRKFAVTVSNGTVAVDAAVEALGVTSGDEVIMPTFTIISCINQIVRSGATPVLIDCDPVTWNMDVAQIESKITPQTKVIMIVHIYGLPVDVEPILKLAEKYNLRVIEDAAQMHGQSYNNQLCGSFGDISTFSFYPNKHITTGEGGMIVMDDEDLYHKCQSLRNLCFQAEQRFVHEDMGWNLRMSNLQAAVGVAQLERLNDFVLRKREMGQLYSDHLEDLQDFIQLPLATTSYADNIYWVYGIVLKESVSLNAKGVMKALGALGVGTRPFFYPMHLQPVLRKRGLFLNDKHSVSENIAARGLYLPSGLALNHNDIKVSANALRDVLHESL